MWQDCKDLSISVMRERVIAKVSQNKGAVLIYLDFYLSELVPYRIATRKRLLPGERPLIGQSGLLHFK